VALSEAGADLFAGPRPPRHGEPVGNSDKFASDYIQYGQVAKTGASRYAPKVLGDKYGRVLTYWLDQISINEYDEMRMDGQVRAGLQLIKLPIQRAAWFVTCPDEDIAAFVNQVMNDVWEPLVRQALTALEFGYSVFEKVWTVGYGLRVTATQGNLDSSRERVYPFAQILQRMVHLDPRTLYLLAYERSSEFAGVSIFTPETSKIAANKAFLFAHDAEFGQIHGTSRLKPCYPYWFFKKLQYENVNVFNETCATPIRRVRYPVGRYEENGEMVNNMDVALEIGASLRNNHTVAVPSQTYEGNGTGGGAPLWDIDYLETGRSGDEMIAYIDHLNVMILKSLLVPQLALEIGGSGSYALAQEQIDFFLQSEEALAQQLAAAINSQIIDQLVYRNFGPKAPKAKIQIQGMTKMMSEGLQNILMESLGNGRPIPMADGTLMVPDYRWMAERLGMPVTILDKDDMALYNQANEAANPMPPGGDMPFDGGPGGYPGQGGNGGEDYSGQGQTSAPQSGGKNSADQDGVDLGDWAVVDSELVWVPRCA
jgi:hypothetical protein